MGFLNKIVKEGKRILKGVEKRFKRSRGRWGKILNSPFGKVLMLVAAIYTGGAALGAWSFGGFAVPQGAGAFATKFITGVNKVAAFMAGGSTGAGGGFNLGAGEAASVAAEGAASASAAEAVAGTTAPTAAEGALAAPLGVAAPAAPVTAVAPTATPSMMSRASGILSKPATQQLIGGMLQGYGQQQQVEDQLDYYREDREYGNRMWDRELNPEGLDAAHQASGQTPGVPPGYLNRARDAFYGRTDYRGGGNYGPADPNTVANYARRIDEAGATA